MTEILLSQKYCLYVYISFILYIDLHFHRLILETKNDDFKPVGKINIFYRN